MSILRKQKVRTHSGFRAVCSRSTTHWYSRMLWGSSLGGSSGWMSPPGHKSHPAESEEAQQWGRSITQHCSFISYLDHCSCWLRWRNGLLWSCELLGSKKEALYYSISWCITFMSDLNYHITGWTLVWIYRHVIYEQSSASKLHHVWPGKLFFTSINWKLTAATPHSQHVFC